MVWRRKNVVCVYIGGANLGESFSEFRAMMDGCFDDDYDALSGDIRDQ